MYDSSMNAPPNMVPVTSSSGGEYVGPPTTMGAYGGGYWYDANGYWYWQPYQQPVTLVQHVPVPVQAEGVSPRVRLALDVVKILPATDPLAEAARKIIAAELK